MAGYKKSGMEVEGVEDAFQEAQRRLNYCLVCGSTDLQSIGCYVPEDEWWPLSCVGRNFFYALCRKCRATKDIERQVELIIWKGEGGGFA